MTKRILFVIPFLIAAVSLSGCATSSHTAPKNQGTTIGQYTDDAIITSKVKSKLLKDLALKSFGISVATNRHIVVLSGNLPTNAKRSRAMRIALNTKHVMCVDGRQLLVRGKHVLPTQVCKGMKAMPMRPAIHKVHPTPKKTMKPAQTS